MSTLAFEEGDVVRLKKPRELMVGVGFVSRVNKRAGWIWVAFTHRGNRYGSVAVLEYAVYPHEIEHAQ